MTTPANITPTAENGAMVFTPLNKLKKHPKNAHKAKALTSDRLI